MRIISTGIQGLDAQFGGGIPSGSTILSLSDPSNAPHIFCEQFAAGGLNALERVIYYNLERPQDEVLEHLRAFVPNPDLFKHLEYVDAYAHKFRELGAPTLKRLGLENHGPKVVEDLPQRLMKLPHGQPFRVVVESLSESIDAFGLEPTLKMVTTLTGLVRVLDGAALVMMIKGIVDHATEIRLRHAADGVVEFGVDRQGFGLYSYLSVTKMRGVSDATRLLLYKETDKGLWLESTRRVF